TVCTGKSVPVSGPRIVPPKMLPVAELVRSVTTPVLAIDMATFAVNEKPDNVNLEPIIVTRTKVIGDPVVESVVIARGNPPKVTPVLLQLATLPVVMEPNELPTEDEVRRLPCKVTSHFISQPRAKPWNPTLLTVAVIAPPGLTVNPLAESAAKPSAAT